MIIHQTEKVQLSKVINVEYTSDESWLQGEPGPKTTNKTLESETS